MLAMAERDGYVGASVGGLAARSGVTIEQCREALDLFLAPDLDSRTPDNEGRRIAVAERGWLILNYGKFRDQRDMLAKREQDAERQRRHRAKAQPSRNVTDVTPGHTRSRDVAHADAAPDAPPEEESPSLTGFEAFWTAYDKKVDRKDAIKAWTKLSPDDRAAATAAAPAYAASTPEKKFRKHPSVWLNGACWTNEIVTAGSGKTDRFRPPARMAPPPPVDENGWPIDP